MKKVLIVLVVLILVFVGVVATRPSEFKIERSTTIAAPAPVVFTYVNTPKKFPEWSPWDELDPGMKKEFTGPAEGVGGAHYWKGNDKVGEGRQTITESVPTQKVVQKLEFIAPFEATNKVTYTLTPAGAGTNISWAMEGSSSFMMKAVGLFMNMDATVGADFEKGLAKMKMVAEKRSGELAAEAAKAAADAAAAAAPTGPTGPVTPEKKPAKKK